MHVRNVIHAAHWKCRTQKWRKKSPSRHHRTTLSGYIFATKACIDNRKQLYLLHMSLQYGELRPTSGWDHFVSLGHPSKFQRVSRLGFVTAVTLLNGSQPNFAWCLAVSCAATLYIHFWWLLPRNRSLPGAKFTLCLQSCALLLAALLHGTRAVGISQTLRRWAQGATYIPQGDHHVGHSHILVYQMSFQKTCRDIEKLAVRKNHTMQRTFGARKLDRKSEN